MVDPLCPSLKPRSNSVVKPAEVETGVCINMRFYSNHHQAASPSPSPSPKHPVDTVKPSVRAHYSFYCRQGICERYQNLITLHYCTFLHPQEPLRHIGRKWWSQLKLFASIKKKKKASCPSLWIQAKKKNTINIHMKWVYVVYAHPARPQLH